MRQLDCLWLYVMELLGRTPTDAGTQPDPGDITVYFENGLA
jgi:hypothetical protein